MAKEVSDLFVEALKLAPAARAALADSLIESLDDEVDENAEALWRTEIAHRVEELSSGAVQSIAWEDVRRQLRSRTRS